MNAWLMFLTIVVTLTLVILVVAIVLASRTMGDQDGAIADLSSQVSRNDVNVSKALTDIQNIEASTRLTTTQIAETVGSIDERLASVERSLVGLSEWVGFDTPGQGTGT